MSRTFYNQTSLISWTPDLLDFLVLPSKFFRNYKVEVLSTNKNIFIGDPGGPRDQGGQKGLNGMGYPGRLRGSGGRGSPGDSGDNSK